MLFMTLGVNSQQLFFSNDNGFAIGELKTIKKVMLYQAVSIGVEIKLKWTDYLKLSMGYSTLRYSITDTAGNNVFVSKYFMELPFAVKRYYKVSQRSYLSLQFGINSIYHFQDKSEIMLSSGKSIIKQPNLGFNFAGIGIVGFRTELNQRILLDFHFGGEHDLLFAYKNKNDKINRRIYSFGLSIYKTLR
jgi:hypothetical protein